MENFLILGHRGYRAKFVENTIEAFQKAREYGADGIEFDSRLTKDGHVVVLHDDSINNMKLRDLTLKELGRITFPNGQTVPTLEESIKALDRDAYLNLEIKEAEAAVSSYEIINKMDALDRTLFSSFNVDALKKIREVDKYVKIGFLLEYETLNNLDQLHKELSFYSLNLWIDALKDNMNFSKNFLKKWKSKGVRIFLWTVNDPTDLYRFKGFYDGIITDEVELIVKERERVLS
ncbi:hypothetical protein PW5551_05235 [Petrotoga sp. 9PW.55.5.1]|uniref:glycerophosphodiester phosphodiesterase family protein n=1 Tax=Petrotoga sp. 9PW.55.5.1 TaxID=1308979 RepID=UPI000DC5CFE3|nr:glycerophosphodiester phosphodiesterase family protein [Petrotoga sp. 9PW.55.5.1]RAO99203.1 hypothetical protein PW5551_05235 [Petrotoga sp. 9PW.55.5.1]